MTKFDKSNRIAELQAKLEAEQTKVNQEIAIFESLPDLPIEPKFILVNRLYGVVASVDYNPSYGESILPYIDQILAAFPAIAIHKTAPGSSYQSYLPDVEHCKAEYTKDGRTTVKGWLDAGYYLFKMDAVEGYTHTPIAGLKWFTWLNGEVVKIEIDLKEIGMTMIYYSLKHRTMHSTEYEWRLSDRWNKNDLKSSTSWASVKGLNPVTVYSPSGLHPFEMFNFDFS